jgi:WD40 repeat protein
MSDLLSCSSFKYSTFCLFSLYTFDMRHLDRPLNMHKDFTSAVIGVDYSPTGREFVAGGYDKMIRIFDVARGHSREVYHTKRMQRVTCVAWSKDNKYIYSGSDEMNVRMWKARASEQLGLRRPRERAAIEYAEALKEKFAAHPQIKKIARHRQIPKHVRYASKELRIMKESKKRKYVFLKVEAYFIAVFFSAKVQSNQKVLNSNFFKNFVLSCVYLSRMIHLSFIAHTAQYYLHPTIV